MADASDDGDEPPQPEDVEERYDFDDFGPADMAEMSPEEWEAAFDADSWVTGRELLDRVEQELNARVATREVFAVVERDDTDEGERIVAYSDEGYAVVHPDGAVEGQGTVLRDVKPTVALCSMPDYEPAEVTEERGLPDPEAVTERGRDLGNLVLQVVGLAQVIAGLILFGAWVGYALHVVVAFVAFAFVAFGVLLLTVVANARLSDRFRAEEYRERLRSAGVDSEERPAFVPGSGAEGEDRDTE
ncbi:MAG: hypothetical protein ABEJ68_00340 [Halobacteriaceae archaeon]